MAVGSLMYLAVLVTTSCTAAEAADGQEVYRYLADRAALSWYMSDFVDTIGRDLADAPLQVNGAFRPTAINVYIVDSSRLDPSRLDALGIPSIGDAVALEDGPIVVIDERHLKELITLSILFWEHEWPMPRAMTELELRGLPALRQLWDPSLNRSLSSDEVKFWRISFRGALGFLLAHELGHITMGQSEPEQIRRKKIFRNRRERDIHWACPDLVDERAAAHREIEARADTYAVRMLQAHSGGRSPGKYEIGAEWYFGVLLERSFIEALGRIQELDEKPELKHILEQRYGPQFATLLAKVRAQANSRLGAVSAFYPRTHPSALARLSLALDVDPNARLLAEAWAERMRRECASLTPQ